MILTEKEFRFLDGIEAAQPDFGMKRIKIHCRHGETEVVPT